MALSKIIENSLADEAVSSAKLKDFSAAVDLNGVELVLDADADTSITADTDDRIDFKIAGVEHFSFSNSSGDTIIKPMVDAKDIKFQQYDGRTLLDINDGGFVGIANGATGPGTIRIFEDTDNGSNYVGLAAGSISSSLTFTLPTADGSSGQFLKTDGSGALSFDTVSSAADDLTAGDAAVSLTTTAGNITIDAQGNDTDIIFKGTDGSSDTTFLTLDGSAAGAASFNGAITANAGVVIDNITIDGTEIDLSSGDLTVDVAGDIILDADGADIIFKDAGTSILTITNNSTDVDFIVATQDKDINFKGDDGGSGITALSLDMSDAGTAIFNHDIKIADDGQIGSASAADAMIISSGGIVTFKDDIKIKDGGTIGTASDADSITIAATGEVSFSKAGTFTVADNSDTLTLKSTDDDAATGPVLNLVRDSASPADGDSIGRIYFTGDNDAGEPENFVRFKAAIVDASNGSEDGQLRISRMIAGGDQNVLSFLDSETVVNDDSKDLDFRVESDNDANALFVQGSDGHVGLGISAPEARLHIFDGDASVGPNANGDELVVEDNDNCGISILSSNNAYGSIFFGDSGDDDIGQIRYDHSGNSMTFFANAQHFFKIASNGEVAINDTEINTGGTVFKVKGALNNTVAIFDHRNTSGSEELIRFRDGDAQTCGSIDIAPGSNTVSYATSSDYRLKQSEEDITDGITKVKQLKPYRFNWKSLPSGDKVDGFFAHEVSPIVPMAVRNDKDETQTLKNVVLNADGTVKDSGILESEWEKGKTEEGGEIFASNTTWVAEKTGEPKYQVIDHSKLVPVLTAALKESITKIEALEARVTTLEG